MMERFSLISAVCTKRLRRAIGALALAGLCQPAIADVLAHHISLSGTIGDQQRERANLIESHQACVVRNRAVGLPIRQATTPELPAEVITEQMELYYAADQVVQDTRIIKYELDSKECGITRVERRFKDLYTPRGHCAIDYRKNSAKGQCSSDDPPMMPAPLRRENHEEQLRALSSYEPPPFLSPAQRAQFEQARADTLRRAPPVVRRATGERRTIAGMPCDVYRSQAPQTELCVARPESRFALLSSSFNLGVPGLLLSTESDPITVTLRAARVSLHQQVSDDVFSVPAGVTRRR